MTLFNIFGAKRLPLAEGIFVTCHFFAFAPVVITLLVLSPKASARDVFTGFVDYGAGWPSISWTVMVGQVSSMFIVLGETVIDCPLSLVCLLIISHNRFRLGCAYV